MNSNQTAQAIEFYAKNVYGEFKMYVKDEEMALKISKLTKQTTLTDWAKNALEGLGFSFVEVIAPR